MEKETVRAAENPNGKIILHPSRKVIDTEITLPASKSISNRVLIINALANKQAEITNLSGSDDTQVLRDALASNSEKTDIGAAGTAMRFLTAYYAIREGTKILTGCQRMKQRPISILVDALKILGADIQYLENEGFPPLKITGKKLFGNSINLDGSVSSQYISALMMIAPCLKNGLTVNLTGKIVSMPYIKMTAGIMQYFGAEAFIENNTVKIPPKKYISAPFEIEPDYSAASYWYEVLAIAGKGRILLKNLKQNSLQGDSRVAELFENLGVTTAFTQEGAVIEANGKYAKEFRCDFTDCPDLVQTFAVACCIKNIPFLFDGVSNLKIKETDRVAALIIELRRLGCELAEPYEGSLAWNGNRCHADRNSEINTYNDHRMAMAFAPASLKMPLAILNPQVVSKSYPDFWKDFLLIC